MTSILIRGGRIFDPATGVDAVGDVFVTDGRIAALGTPPAETADVVVEAEGCLVLPGFVDLHAHLREPGFEQKGTIATETEAALRGGFTTVCAMPNTEPPPDSAPQVADLLERFRRDARVRVLPVGCITRGRQGRALAELAELAAAGCVAFSDDGSPVADARLMRRAMELAADLGVPLSEHCDEPALSRGGVMNEGALSERLGLPGAPASAEVAAIARNIALAEETGARLHIAHVSTARGVELIADAKARGIPVTAEVTPSHLFLTEEAVWGPGSEPAYDTNARINPPLRSEADRRALIEGLEAGVIDAIATDHAPHAAEDKACEFDRAAPGISCFETAVGTLWTQIARGELRLATVVRALTAGPASAFALGHRVPGIGTLTVGGAADVVVVDPSVAWRVDPSAFASKGKNTPLAGCELVGRVRAVIAGGVLWKEEASLHAGRAARSR
ncbi:Dihydroorotase [bacterium HR29]|jgi:dihydroorotase|nr:Dihydroorotase [bacterium HR29]